jgi:hypothetical protein
VHLTRFDYTEKNVITIKNESEIIRKEIARVKNLPLTSKGWTSNPNTDEELYFCDSIDQVKGISSAKSVLLEAQGIKTVNDLLELQSDATKFNDIIKRTKGIGRKGLQTFTTNCSTALPGTRPSVEYYINSPNP